MFCGKTTKSREYAAYCVLECDLNRVLKIEWGCGGESSEQKTTTIDYISSENKHRTRGVSAKSICLPLHALLNFKVWNFGTAYPKILSNFHILN